MHPIVKNRIMGCYENHAISRTHNPNVFILGNIVFFIKVVIMKELPPLIYCLRVQGRSLYIMKT